ncbi:MAG TPA: condensation domain-containing protein, partial [Vicinamibacteria bacterium]|nr:condensation domain-containing protein [Vicinamibacteria bacterium]
MSASVSHLVARLRALDVRVWSADGRLHYDAPPGVVTATLKAELAGRKEEILAFLREGRRRSAAVPLLERRPRAEAPALSFAQQRLWLLDQLGAGSAYNVSGAFRLVGHLDTLALERSLAEIVRRHESLRTTFEAVAGRPVQRIAAEAGLRLSLVDLQSSGPEGREAEARRLASEEARRPFDLTRGPLVRTTLIVLTEREHALLLTIHHIVADGWSLGIFARELAALYTSFAAGRGSELPEPPFQYVDFATWQREWLQGETLNRQVAYWRAQLEGATTLRMPTDRPRPAVSSFRGAVCFRLLPAGLLEAVGLLGQAESATPFMILLAAFQALLQRYTGQDDIMVGSPIANRNHAALEGVIGFFVNMLVLRTDCSGSPTFRQLVSRVRGVALDAYEHQDLPFEKLVEELGVKRDVAHSPLVQVTFALQHAPTEALELPGLSLRPQEVEVASTHFDLEMHLGESPAGLSAALVYDTQLFAPTTAERLLRYYERLLEAAVLHPETPIAALPLLETEERGEMLALGEGGRESYPREATVTELFEGQVERTPDELAVVFGEERLTYRELNARANRLAHRLRGLGVGREVRVGICVERSAELVVGLLGILKAGGAYVPLDPSYPKERLALMIEDAQVGVLLTEEGKRE